MKKKEVFLVPYAHLDTQWRWEFPTTINKYIKNTMDENFLLFNKYPEHRFNFTGTLRYQMMKDYYPEKFEQVKELVKEGRWLLAGTCLDETDVLIPSVESNIRNILYGDRWQKQEFGQSSRDYMIPDCFGFPMNMPTVMDHCGITGFSSNKLTWGSAVGVPFEIGMWKGPDGSEIVSAFNPCRYDAHLELPVHLNPARQNRLNRLGKNNDIWKSFQYYGVGDIGGAPFEISVKHAISSMKHYEKANKAMAVKQGSPDQFFSAVTEDEKVKMDRYEGDLLLVEHSAGTLTSAAIMKRWNRLNEQMAFAAEAAAVYANQLLGLPYPNIAIKTAWERICGSQMHDIIPGTSTPLAYEYSQNDEVLALNTWQSILEDSARSIAPYITGDGDILLFNSIEHQRFETVDIVRNDVEPTKEYLAADAFGNKYPVQLRREDDQWVVTFRPELRAFGWTRFKLEEISEIASGDLVLFDDGSTVRMESAFYSVEVTDKGSVKSIYDKKRKREILGKPMAYEFQKELPAKFPAWNMDWSDRKKPPFMSLSEGGIVEVTEDGPVRKTIRITYVYNDSTFIKEISLGADEDCVKFKEKIDWFESGCSLKLALHTTMDTPTATYNWETSRIERGINHKKQYEVPSRLWVDLSQDDFGFTLTEDSKYGYDRPSEDVLRMTLLYTPGVRWNVGFKDQKTHDFGAHTISYAIRSHSGDCRGADVFARAFNQKIRAFSILESDVIVGSDIKTTADESFLKIDSDQIGLTALKKAEDHEAVVIRLYERYGSDAVSNVTFSKKIKEAYRINGLEEKLADAEWIGNRLHVDVVANGISAYMVVFDEAEKVRVNQSSLDLPMNCRLFGKNDEMTEAILPLELVPDVVINGDVRLLIEKTENNNALIPNGEEVILEGFNSLTLLAATKEEKEVAFEWLDSEGNVISVEKRVIPTIEGYAGLWDTRKWKKPVEHDQVNRRDYTWLNKYTGLDRGYVKRHRIGWYASHTHDRGEDKAYKYGYLYNISLSKPEGAVTIRLPEADMYIASATAYESDTEVASINYLKDSFDY